MSFSSLSRVEEKEKEGDQKKEINFMWLHNIIQEESKGCVFGNFCSGLPYSVNSTTLELQWSSNKEWKYSLNVSYRAGLLQWVDPDWTLGPQQSHSVTPMSIFSMDFSSSLSHTVLYFIPSVVWDNCIPKESCMSRKCTPASQVKVFVAHVCINS